MDAEVADRPVVGEMVLVVKNCQQNKDLLAKKKFDHTIVYEDEGVLYVQFSNVLHILGAMDLLIHPDK